MGDLGAIVRPEREALVADLEAIDEAAWATGSLCPGWTVRDVLAHMTALARMTPARFFQKLIACGFSPSRLQANDIVLEKGGDVVDTLARFPSIVAARNRLPGQDRTILGETLVHAEDIRRPLGIRHAYPVEALVAIADHYKSSNLVAGSRRRIAGVSFRATDVAWSTGSGPVISGTMLLF